MALEKAGINLTLQGEAQYIAGLRNVNREMDLMATNTKLAVAQLGQGASPTKRYATQMKSLSAEIAKSSTQTMILRNRNKELPNLIYDNGKALDVLKDKYKEQSIVMKPLQDDYEKLTHHQKYNSTEMDHVVKAYNEQKEVMSATKIEIDQLEGAYNGMLDEYERMPNSMASAQLATQNLLNEQIKLREEYLKGGGVFTGFADKLASAGGTLQKYGRHLSDLGDSFKGISVGILAGGGGALKAYMDWESALRGAMKTNDEVVDSNGNVTYSYAEFEEGLRGLSKEIPVANTELAELAEIAGMLQVPTDEVVGFVEVIAKLGETTNLGTEEAAEQLGKFINITGAGTDKVLNLANALVELGNNTASSEQETLRMSTRWASTGKIIGLTDDQILALSASVISLGIRTEAGGSAVQRSFLKINDAVLEGGDTLALFAEQADMSSTDFQKAWQDDAAQALIPFLKGLNDTHEAGGNVNSVLRELGISSVNELNTLLVLAGGYDQLSDNLEMTAAAYHETDEAMMALNQEAELAYGTTLGKLRIAWNRLKDSLIDIGEPIADAVIDIVEGAEPLFQWIEDLATGFSNLDESAQRNIISTVGKIALIAPALKLAGGMMTTTGTLFEMTSDTVRKSGEIITRAMLGTKEGAVLASGAEGVGGLVAVLSGSGAGALPWALGIAAVALGGWTLWKTWGEDAWEAGQRTKQWGTDVGEATDGVLTDIGDAIGTFGLLQHGVETDTALMVGDFQKMGESIEGDINRRLEITGEYLSGLPDVLRESLEEIMGEYQAGLEETREIVTKNNEEIARVQADIAEQGGKATAEQLAYINELQRHSASEYIGILNLSADEERAIKGALAGDLEGISKKQTLDLVARLNEENKALDVQRLEVKEGAKNMLKEIGLANTEYGKKMLSSIDEYYDAMQVTGERTMQELVSIYPELAKTHDLATGNILSSVDQVREKQLASNAMLLESWTDSHREMEKSSQELARAQDLIVDSSRKGAETWNKVIADSGGNLGLFKENLLEATKTAEGWNDIRFQIHDVNLDSNARLVIAEVAIENGRWENMMWEDKQALLKDNFSETVYQALVDEGTWDKLEWQEQVAVLNNEFSDGVAQAIMDESKWAELPWEQKKAILTTNSPETLMQILEDLGVWRTVPIAIRKLLADGSQVSTSVAEAQRKIDSLRGTSVTIETKYDSIYTTYYRSGGGTQGANNVNRGLRPLNKARGTDFHPGGMSMVNDQTGATYRELVTLPDGRSFIPEGRDVLLDLPKGSKVLRAALTKMKFPDIKQYQDGVGYSGSEIRNIQSNNQQPMNVDMSKTNRLLQTLIQITTNGQTIHMNGKEVGRSVYQEVDNLMSRNFNRSSVMSLKGG